MHLPNLVQTGGSLAISFLVSLSGQLILLEVKISLRLGSLL